MKKENDANIGFPNKGRLLKIEFKGFMIKVFKIIREKLSIWLSRPTVYYYFKFGDNKNKINPPKNSYKEFLVVENYEKYLELANVYCIYDEKLEHKQRFADGAKMLLLINKESIVCSGWLITNFPNFQINFNKTKLDVGKRAVNFFDFRTSENYRRKGYYQTLLVEALNAFHGYDFLIYTATTNIGSRKGILGAGFTELGTHRRITNRGLFKKLKSLNIDVKRG